jgi:hypothetical protein
MGRACTLTPVSIGTSDVVFPKKVKALVGDWTTEVHSPLRFPAMPSLKLNPDGQQIAVLSELASRCRRVPAQAVGHNPGEYHKPLSGSVKLVG